MGVEQAVGRKGHFRFPSFRKIFFMREWVEEMKEVFMKVHAEESYQIQRFREKIEQEFQKQNVLISPKKIEETKERIAEIQRRHGEQIEPKRNAPRDFNAKLFDENQHSAPASKAVTKIMNRLQHNT